MIIEALIAGATTIVVSSLIFAKSVLNGIDKKDREDDIAEAKHILEEEATARKWKLEDEERARKLAEPKPTPKARKAYFAEKRRLLQAQRDAYAAVFEPGDSDFSKSNWKGITDLDKELIALAKEEAGL